MTQAVTKRAHWGSKIGFILAAAGSAVGLGAIWKFPYVAGKSGGGAFLLVYLACLFTVGVVMLIAEMLIGRLAKRSITTAYRELAGKWWPWAGRMSVLCVFLILGFYCVVGGWTLEYIVASIDGSIITTDKAVLAKQFAAFSGDVTTVLIATAVFLMLTAGIVIAGVQSGIERICKILMPTLFILMLLLISQSLFLPGAMQGVSYFFTPDWSKVTITTVLDALGLAVFSLSVGAGLMVAYGSYLESGTKVVSAGMWIASLAAFASVLAGLMILPAVFAFGVNPAAGPSLTFITMPMLFAQMPFGQVLALVFFALLFFAALTSSISILEPVVAFLIDEYQLPRRRATLIAASTNYVLLGIPAALSFGEFSGAISLWGKTPFDVMDYLASNILMPIGGMLCAIFVGWVIWHNVQVRLEQELSTIAIKTYWLIAAIASPILIGAVALLTILG
ncbi:hypothetical protein PALB_10150 [Pseudoalteromonas luteoviolacea B = ATCC 29581]|nr:hypothetical protein PALB_10150 [Pseudoalteromonas luteoviolacea B = ATCC 29581]